MSPRLLRFLIPLMLALVITTGYYCTSPSSNPKSELQNPESKWLNVYDTAAHYVGMGTCKQCHASVYESFIQTGMGQSFDSATHKKSAADFGAHAIVYDKDLDFYYKPFWQGDSLYFMEFRLEGKDTVHKRIEHINYIVGSGQHTNSHIFNINGYLYQAPITFYTQKRQWDLAPGFEKGSSTRFSRLIESECMTCHNGLPDFVPNSQNKYTALKTGIDCERCHGPGSLHVADRSTGKIVDTSKGPDYTIVNPRRLTTELQNNICQRCHLQGVAVLNDGKTFFDFHPGMKLSEMENVFMPEYEGAQDKMIMASHVERMKKSPCYINSGKMSCITCHNPHVSVKFTPRTQYLNACYSCHKDNSQSAISNQSIAGTTVGTRPEARSATDMNAHGCTETAANRAKKNNDCITCHMPHNGSIDIPHVAVTDHYIRKRPVEDSMKRKITAFLGLKCFNNDKVDAITTARGYMEFYERYNQSRGLIDSALFYLARQQGEEASTKQNRDYIRAYFLLEDYGRVQQYAASLKPVDVSDAWTCYRIGESFYHLQQAGKGLEWYAQAIKIWPYALDFQNKYGTCLLAAGKAGAAEQVFKFILLENPKYALASSNLGYLYMQRNPTLAYEYLIRAYALDPDHEQTAINLAVWNHNNNDNAAARKYLERLLKRHPQNEQARAMLLDLGRGS